MSKIGKIIDNSGLGSVSESTSRSILQNEIREFGKECFDAGLKSGYESIAVDPEIKTFEEYLKSVDND